MTANWSEIGAELGLSDRALRYLLALDCLEIAKHLSQDTALDEYEMNSAWAELNDSDIEQVLVVTTSKRGILS